MTKTIGLIGAGQLHPHRARDCREFKRFFGTSPSQEFKRGDRVTKLGTNPVRAAVLAI